MKLSKEIKDKIDKYFAEISADDLFRISVEKYGLVEEVTYELTNQNETCQKSDYNKSSYDDSYGNSDCEELYALAA